jgi:hypothetical protein
MSVELLSKVQKTFHGCVVMMTLSNGERRALGGMLQVQIIGVLNRVTVVHGGNTTHHFPNDDC